MVRAKRCHQSAAKVTQASGLLALLLVSIAALGVALGSEWARVDLVQNNGCPCNCTHAPCKQICCANKFSVYLSPFVLGNETQAKNGTVSSWVNIYQALGFNNPPIDISALPVVVACSLASGVLSFICLFVTSANLYLNAKSRFCYDRPTATVIYLLCLFSSLLSVTALAAFLDFYIWKLRDGAGLLPDIYFRINTVPYFLLVRLDWAFYVHASGACCSVIAFLVAWAMATSALTSRAATPPTPQVAPPLYPAVAVTSLVYDKELGRWVAREKPRLSENELAMEAYKGSKDAGPKSTVTTLLY